MSALRALMTPGQQPQPRLRAKRLYSQGAGCSKFLLPGFSHEHWHVVLRMETEFHDTDSSFLVQVLVVVSTMGNLLSNNRVKRS